MTISETMLRMLELPGNTPHDIAHLMKVWGYAKTIGELEGLDARTQYILETAAILHDIACPYCREKYGSAPGKLQEKESEPLVREFFKGTDTEPEVVERVNCLVCHHHTVTGVDGADWQILLEADYLVNADEGGASPENIRNTLAAMYRTETGKRLLSAVYKL